MSVDILIVEDHPTMRQSMRIILEREGYSIREAGDGRTAMRLIEEQQPDVVLLDLNLPPPTGASILRWIKQDAERKAIKVVVVTALGEETREDVMSLGADCFFVKPFSPLELISTVEEMLGGELGAPGDAPDQGRPE